MFKKNGNSEANANTSMATVSVSEAPAYATTTGNEVAYTGELLNLQKNDFLDLTKTDADFKNMRVSAGWDVATNGDAYDLDICAFLLDNKNRFVRKGNSRIYYGDKQGKGIYLDGDNLTGEGDGDDENIFINLTALPAECVRIIVSVVIYQGRARRQSFKHVQSAYVRLVDNSCEKELCRYNLSRDGGDSTAVVFAELFKNANGAWSFKAIGEQCQASIDDLERRYR